MTHSLDWLLDSPLTSFTVLLLVALIVPSVFERLRLPGLVGLLVAGVCLGADGLGLLDPETETIELLSDIGKIYLMFVAGLEINLEDFRRKKNRSIAFGATTFLIPMIAGTLVGQMFGMGWNASILIGSLLASHTLLGYPIVNRLGVVPNEAVVITIGATIFTDISALLVLAICLSIHAGEFTAIGLISQLGALAVYTVLILFGFGWAGKEYFRRTGDEQSNQFLFVLLVVFLAAVGAQAINVDKIVGAFLAGLAVNEAMGHGPVQEKVEFVGGTLFIPCFFIDMGLLLDLPNFIKSLTSELALTVAIVVALIGSKFLAAFVIKPIYHYTWNETLTMWSLSLPQVAATLAAALAGYKAGVIPESVFNTIIVLMVVTSLLGPVLTARFARHLTIPKPDLALEVPTREIEAEFSEISDRAEANRHTPFTVVIPIYNPHTERYLIEMGALLARHQSGQIIPLTIAKAHVHMDEPDLNESLKRSYRLLERAVEVSREFSVKSDPVVRIDDDVAHGISRTAREREANLIVMGWSPTTSLQARLLGNTIDSVLWSAHCPVAAMRLLDEPTKIRNVLVPVKNMTPQALHAVQFAQLFADANQATVLLLHVSDRQTSKETIEAFETEFDTYMNQSRLTVDWTIQTICQDDTAEAIVKTARSFDMVVLRSVRRRTVAGLAVSDVTTQVLSEITCSAVLFGEPHA